MSETFMVTFHWKGDTEELQERYNKVLSHVVDVSPARPIVHLAAPVADGFKVYDVWTSEQVARNMVENPAFQQKLKDFGLGEVELQFTTVHRMGWPISESPMYR
ncbi:MAG TPA: hypothetical protein GXZ30_10185 [Propionibacterium sp.]|jgi:hypothetical protein|nr:hypothetical protein [Propionibacterium sp.]